MSRKDEIWTSAGGLVSIAGGKLSAYRAMAERVVDLVVERLGTTTLPCATADAPLPGGGHSVDYTLSGKTQLDDHDAERLVGLYGDEAGEIIATGGDVMAEAARAVTHEGAVTLEDYWVRRSARAWFDYGAGLASLAPAANAMGALLGWDETTKAAQVAHCHRINDESRRLLDAD